MERITDRSQVPKTLWRGLTYKFLFLWCETNRPKQHLTLKAHHTAGLTWSIHNFRSACSLHWWSSFCYRWDWLNAEMFMSCTESQLQNVCQNITLRAWHLPSNSCKKFLSSVFKGGNQSCWDAFFQKANFLVKVNFGTWRKIFWMVKQWILSVKLTKVLFGQFVSRKTSCLGCALARFCRWSVYLQNSSLFSLLQWVFTGLPLSCKPFLWAGAQLQALLWVNGGSSEGCMVCTWTLYTVTPTYTSSPCFFTALFVSTLTLFPLPEVLHFDIHMVGSSIVAAPCYGAVLVLTAAWWSQRETASCLEEPWSCTWVEWLAGGTWIGSE